jgi:hypothetical protein
LVEDFAEECSNLVRILEKDAKERVHARWRELSETKRPDFFHALNYDVIAGGYASGEKPLQYETGIRIPPNIRELMKKEWR